MDREVVEEAVGQCYWLWLAMQSIRWHAIPQGEVGHRVTAILAAEWQRVLGQSFNSKRPLVFSHILTKILGVYRANKIWDHITRRMELWERGVHSGIVDDAEK